MTLVQSGCSGESEKWSFHRSILKVEQLGFADTLMRVIEKQEPMTTPSLGVQAARRMELSFSEMGKWGEHV